MVSVISRIFLKLKKLVLKPRIRIESASGPLVRLGTAYGGKTFVDRGDLFGTTILSAGLGEDASFDVEFAARYNAKILIIDPTPRSINYYNGLIKRVGLGAASDYGESGCLPLESYDMSGIVPGQLELVPRALWTEECCLKFYVPRDPRHVSHSITNFQNEYDANTDHIEVEATTVEVVVRRYGLDSIPLLKMDIEGAELSVIEHLMKVGPYPDQILVEFDEMARPSRAVRRKYERIDGMLREAGYRCVFWDGYSDYSYERAR